MPREIVLIAYKLTTLLFFFLLSPSFADVAVVSRGKKGIDE